MEDTFKTLAKMFSLSIEADAIKAEIEAMKADNYAVDIHYNSPSYSAKHFFECSERLKAIAEEIKGIFKGDDKVGQQNNNA